MVLSWTFPSDIFLLLLTGWSYSSAQKKFRERHIKREEQVVSDLTLTNELNRDMKDRISL